MSYGIKEVDQLCHFCICSHKYMLKHYFCAVKETTSSGQISLLLSFQRELEIELARVQDRASELEKELETARSQSHHILSTSSNHVSHTETRILTTVSVVVGIVNVLLLYPKHGHHSLLSWHLYSH